MIRKNVLMIRSMFFFSDTPEDGSDDMPGDITYAMIVLALRKASTVDREPPASDEEIEEVQPNEVDEEDDDDSDDDEDFEHGDSEEEKEEEEEANGSPRKKDKKNKKKDKHDSGSEKSGSEDESD